MTSGIISFDIDVSAILRLAAVLPELEDALNVETQRAMEDSVMHLALRASVLTPVNYGTLRSAIHGGFQTQGNVLDVLRGIVGADNSVMREGIAASTYVNYVEHGTPPHWAPIDPLKLWATRVLGNERIGYAVQRAIAARGTKGAHMFQRAWDQGGKDYVEGAFAKVPVKATARFERAAK